MLDQRTSDSIDLGTILDTLRTAGLEARHAFNRAHRDSLDPAWEAIRGDVPWGAMATADLADLEARYLAVVADSGLA